jgi:8-amino-7-oxononanoate synthase
VYTTALPPALAAAASVAVDIARDDHERRARLHRHIAQFRAGAAAQGIDLLTSSSAIQPVLIGASDTAQSISRRLEAAGFYVPAIRPPTVPAGKARLRVTLSSAHAESDVARLLSALMSALRTARDAA